MNDYFFRHVAWSVNPSYCMVHFRQEGKWSNEWEKDTYFMLLHIQQTLFL